MPESVEKAIETGENADMVRCVSIIGFKGHGKTELCEWLVARAAVGKTSPCSSPTIGGGTPRSAGQSRGSTSPSSRASRNMGYGSPRVGKRVSKHRLSSRDRSSTMKSLGSTEVDRFIRNSEPAPDIGHTKVHTLLHLYTPNAGGTVPYSIEGLRQATMKKEGKPLSRVIRPRHTQALLEPGVPLFVQNALKAQREKEGGDESRSGSCLIDEENEACTPLPTSRSRATKKQRSLRIDNTPERASTCTPTAGAGVREANSFFLELPEMKHKEASSKTTDTPVRPGSAGGRTSTEPLVQRRPRRASTVGASTAESLATGREKLKEDKEKPKSLRKAKSARFHAATPLLVYMLDTPGHADFAADVAASLRLSDGALVVVDAIHGCLSHLEVLLRQALAERVRPTLFVSGLERCILEHKMTPEDIHKRMRSIVASINDAIDSCKDELVGDVCIRPEKGDAVFGSTVQGWAFSIHRFADLYYTKFGLDRGDLARRLWAEEPGDELLTELPLGSDPRNTRMATSVNMGSTKRSMLRPERSMGSMLREAAEEVLAAEENMEIIPESRNASFLACDIGAPVKAASKPAPPTRSLLCSLILAPLLQLVHTLMNGDPARQADLLSGLGVELSDSERFLRGEELVQCVLSKWLGAAELVLEMVRLRLPSPKEAQRYRVENLYGGPVDDAAATAVRDCDPQGPMMTFVSRMLPTSEGGLYALGRVFSGTLHCKRPVWVRSRGRSMCDGARGEDAQALHSVECVAMPLGLQGVESVPQAACGNVVAIFGVDQFLLKAGTLTDLEDATDIADLQFSTVRPVVRVAVKPVLEDALPKLTEALRRLSKVDPLVQCAVEEWGEHVLVGSGKHHVDECLASLKAIFAPEEFRVASPVAALRPGKGGTPDSSYHVVYRETVRQTGEVSTAITPNQLCELRSSADPLNESLCNDMEAGMLQLRRLAEEERVHTFVDHYDWSRAEVARIWCYGPGEAGANFVVDGTADDINSSREPHHLEVQGAVTAACQWATREGGLCEEAMRGVRFTLHDVVLHADHLHRGTGQIIGAARRCFLGAQLSAAPCLQEPFLLCEVACEEGPVVDAVRQILTERRGAVLDEAPSGYAGCIRISFQMAAVDTLGLSEELAEAGCTNIVQAAFAHWECVPGDPESDDRHRNLVLALRRWRQLKGEMPTPQDFQGEKAMISPADIFIDELSDLTVSLGKPVVSDELDAGIEDGWEENRLDDVPEDM